MADRPADRVRDAFLDRLRAETAPVAHEPIARVEVPGMSLLLIEASERYEGCPGCAEKDAAIAAMRRDVEHVIMWEHDKEGCHKQIKCPCGWRGGSVQLLETVTPNGITETEALAQWSAHVPKLLL